MKNRTHLNQRNSSISPLISLVMSILIFNVMAIGQGGLATLSGTVTDESGAVIPGAEVTIENRATGLKRSVTTNNSGVYLFPALKPDTYTITAQKDGFAPIEFKDIVLNVGDEKGLAIQMKVGDVAAEVTVEASATLSNESAAISTVVDSNLVENMPLNGRSLQPLIQLSPGVTLLPTNDASGGFVVNGQRASSNQTIVDGVSANTNVTIDPNGFSTQLNGSFASTNVQGSYSSIASIDEVQEFQILTSTFAAEFGRSPGGQVILRTKSGENDFHGSLYEYFRNDALDANDFFNNALDLGKPALRFNHFGGTFSGPLPFLNFGEGVPFFHNGKDRTHFFVSYEGQRFVLPQTAIDVMVPSNEIRQNAPSQAARNLLSYFPQPTGPTVAGQDYAPFRSVYSDPNESDSLGIRIDHNYKGKYTFFGRYKWAPSYGEFRNGQFAAGTDVTRVGKKNESFTLGATQVFTSKLVNDFRFNYTRGSADTEFISDGFGGGGEFPHADIGTDPEQGVAAVEIRTTTTLIGQSGLDVGNTTRQLNFIDNISYSIGSHQLKFGIDFKRLKPTVGRIGVNRSVAFSSFFGGGLGPAINFTPVSGFLSYRTPTTQVFDTFSSYFQDTWKINSKATLTYGVRWDINPSPKIEGNLPFVVLDRIPDLSQNDQSNVGVRVTNRYYDTDFGNFAPRFGISYKVSEKQGRELTLRGGFGVFTSLGTTGFGGLSFPYGGSQFLFGLTVPLQPFVVPVADLDNPPRTSFQGLLNDHKLPRSYQWNVSAEQSLGQNNILKVSYVGQSGRDQISARNVALARNGSDPNAIFHPDINSYRLVSNQGQSDYNSLQVQFIKRLSERLSLNANYTLGYSEDSISTAGFVSSPPGTTVSENLGPSSFDVRHNFTAAATYNIPNPKNWSSLVRTLFGGWAVNTFVVARSALPFSVTSSQRFPGTFSRYRVRPNLTGEPIWIFDDSLAGGRKLNIAAFDFSCDSGCGHGDVTRNSLRGLGAWQVDLSLHKNFRITETLNVKLGIDSFNILNHTNFANPSNTDAFGGRPSSTFGLFRSTLARARSNTAGGTGFVGGNPIFSLGGPRSHQLSVKFTF